MRQSDATGQLLYKNVKKLINQAVSTYRHSIRDAETYQEGRQNERGYSFVQYATADGVKRGYVAASGLAPYVASVTDPGDPYVPPVTDPDVPGIPNAGVEDWPGWYWNKEKDWPTPPPPHDTPRATWAEQKAFNDIWTKYGDIGEDGTVPPTPEQIRNYLVILSCESGVPLDILLATANTESNMRAFFSDGSPFVAGNDWGLMQINEGNKSYYDGSYGDIVNNWHANARVGAMFAKDAYDRIPVDYKTEEDRLKSYYSCYNAKYHDEFERDTLTGRKVAENVENFWRNLQNTRSDDPLMEDSLITDFYNHYGKQSGASLDYLKGIWSLDEVNGTWKR